jgi:hypothetical protein
MNGVMHSRTWAVLFTAGLVFCVLFSGCLGERVSPHPAEEPPVILVDYQRTGGVAGFDDRVVIFDNGVALVSTKTSITEITLGQEDLGRIRELFAAARFGELEARYTSARESADLLQYSITFEGKTVQTEDTVIPDLVRPVIEEMDRMVALQQSPEKGGPQLPLTIP